MAQIIDIKAARKDLEEIQAKIAAKEAEFEKSVAKLREEEADIKSDYAHFLRRELASLEEKPARKPPARTRKQSSINDDDIMDVLQKAQVEVSAGRMREIGGWSKADISPNSLSVRLRRLVEEGRIIKSGERRNSTYRIP